MFSTPLFASVAVAVVAVLAVAASAAPVQDEPIFCHGLDCPKYTVLNSTKDYEVRQYAKSQWARTTVEIDNYTTAVDIGFQRLFLYISGQNVDKKHIPMTAPVTVKVVPGAGPYCNSTFIISFMVPFSFQPNPPQPV